MAEEVASDVEAGVAPAAASWSRKSTRLSNPKMSLARIASLRLSLDIFPMRTTKSQAAKYSGVVSFTSRAKSCMWRINAVITSRTRGLVFGPIALITESVNLSIESSAIFLLSSLLVAPNPDLVWVGLNRAGFGGGWLV